MAFATLDHTAMILAQRVNVQTDTRWIRDCILERDEEQRKIDPANNVVEHVVENVGGNTAPLWAVTFTYENGHQSRYTGTRY